MGLIPGLALGWEDPLEQEMATHSTSSILAWKTPWTEEPDRLQSQIKLSWTTTLTDSVVINLSKKCVCVCVCVCMCVYTRWICLGFLLQQGTTTSRSKLNYFKTRSKISLVSHTVQHYSERTNTALLDTMGCVLNCVPPCKFICR